MKKISLSWLELCVISLSMSLVGVMGYFLIGYLFKLWTFDQGHAWDLAVAIGVNVALIVWIISSWSLVHQRSRFMLWVWGFYTVMLAFLLTHSLWIQD